MTADQKRKALSGCESAPAQREDVIAARHVWRAPKGAERMLAMPTAERKKAGRGA